MQLELLDLEQTRRHLRLEQLEVDPVIVPQRLPVDGGEALEQIAIGGCCCGVLGCGTPLDRDVPHLGDQRAEVERCGRLLTPGRRVRGGYPTPQGERPDSTRPTHSRTSFSDPTEWRSPGGVTQPYAAVDRIRE